MIFWHYGKKLKGAFENNGHSMQFNPSSSFKLTLSGGLLDKKEKYKLAQLHFHWGNNSGQGSEHTISGYQYPLEMHLVHINRKYVNKDSTDYLSNKNGLAVVGIFFEVNDKKAKNTFEVILGFCKSIFFYLS